MDRAIPGGLSTDVIEDVFEKEIRYKVRSKLCPLNKDTVRKSTKIFVIGAFHERGYTTRAFKVVGTSVLEFYLRPHVQKEP